MLKNVKTPRTATLEVLVSLAAANFHSSIFLIYSLSFGMISLGKRTGQLLFLPFENNSIPKGSQDTLFKGIHSRSHQPSYPNPTIIK